MSWLCMGSRVVAKTQDLPKEGYMHTQEAGGLKMVGVPHDAFPGV